MSKSRRKFLAIATGSVAGIGVVVASIPFFKSLSVPRFHKRYRPFLDIRIAKIKPGETKIVEFKGKPLFVTRRSERQIEELAHENQRLRDPESKQSQQPEYATNSHRSLKPDIFVAVGICTHLGCMPNQITDKNHYISEISSGFFCPCHSAKYDLAGRVFLGGPAPFNLEVPDYKYVEEEVIRVSSW